VWAVLDRVEAVMIPSCAASPINHIHLRSATTSSTKPPDSATHAARDVPSFDIVGEERLLQDTMEKALAQDVWIHARIHAPEHPPRHHAHVTAALSRIEVFTKRK
ncbi:hypothetical protein EDB85DRAFT_1979001, partial [Lactarius pseudohatsudake]